jgi:putative SOS response-associated peptidase YedK
MTQLYRLDRSAAQIAEHFGARVGQDPWDGGYLTPGQFAPVITAGREFIAGPRPAKGRLEPRLVPRLWGVSPPPSSDDPLRRIAHCRNPDSPFWIGNLRNSEFRCLIPATRFMLWGSETDYEGRRLKHWLTPERAGLFALAGVWKDEDVPGFALLTRDSTGLAKALGARSMPVVLPADDRAHQTWLHGGWDRAQDLLASTITLAEVDAEDS